MNNIDDLENKKQDQSEENRGGAFMTGSLGVIHEITGEAARKLLAELASPSPEVLERRKHFEELACKMAVPTTGLRIMKKRTKNTKNR